MILITYPVKADELAIALEKDQKAPYSGILITNSQAEDYLKTKDELINCQLNMPNKICKGSSEITTIFFYVFGGFLIGAATGIAFTR